MANKKTKSKRKKAKKTKSGYTTKQIMSPGFQMPSDYNELVKIHKTLAKTADRRLLRLEEYSKEENMGNALQWAYARAMRDIKAWSGEEAKRFDTKPPENKHSILAKIKDIQNFIEKPSSTKAGIKGIYQKRAESVNEEYGTDFTWEDIGDFYEGEMYKRLDESFASDTITETVGKMVQEKGEVKKLFEAMSKLDAKDVNKFLEKQKIFRGDDAVEDKLIKKMVKEYPDEVKEFLGI